MKPNILLIEDEQDLGHLVSQYLRAFNFSVTWCKDARSALVQLIVPGIPFDLLLIDVSMPDMSGFELTEKIISLGIKLPFLFLTARNEKADRLYGLKLGADDYIVKPFDIDELVLRIQNILRRNKTGHSLPDDKMQLVKADVYFFKLTMTLVVGDQPAIELTDRESRLVEYLFANENRIVKREDLFASVWGEQEFLGKKSVDVFISRLRKYLSASKYVSIDNVYGVGFILKVKQSYTG